MAGAAVAGLVLAWSLLGLQPTARPAVGEILMNVAAAIVTVANIAFHKEWYSVTGLTGGWDSTRAYFGRWLGYLWGRASLLEGAAAIVPVGAALLLWRLSAGDKPGSPAELQSYAAMATLFCVSAVALTIIGSRPVNADRSQSQPGR